MARESGIFKITKTFEREDGKPVHSLINQRCLENSNLGTWIYWVKGLFSYYCVILFAVGRILDADECPLEIQSQWKVGEQRTFTLTQAEFEVKTFYLSLKKFMNE